jgi:hypothetical protein
VPDGVCVVRASYLKESLEVVCRWPRLTLVAVCGSCDTPRVGATCLPVVAIIVVGHGRGPLRMLVAPLLAALSAILGTVDGNIERCLLAATWGRLPASLGGMMCDHLTAGGVRVGDAVRLLGGVPKNVTPFVWAWVLSMAHRSCARARLASLSARLGFDVLALPPQRSLGREISWW